MRPLLIGFVVAAAVALAVASCSSDSTPSAGADASTPDSGNVCDVNGFTGVGKACPYVSSKLCFPQCDAGGCRCVASGSGPVWSCVNDFTCLPDAGPLDDAPADDVLAPDVSQPDASDAGASDAPANG